MVAEARPDFINNLQAEFNKFVYFVSTHDDHRKSLPRPSHQRNLPIAKTPSTLFKTTSSSPQTTGNEGTAARSINEARRIKGDAIPSSKTASQSEGPRADRGEVYSQRAVISPPRTCVTCAKHAPLQAFNYKFMPGLLFRRGKWRRRAGGGCRRRRRRRCRRPTRVEDGPEGCRPPGVVWSYVERAQDADRRFTVYRGARLHVRFTRNNKPAPA